MRFSFSIVLAFSVLAACGGPTLTPQQKVVAAQNLARNDAIWASRQAYVLGGVRYEVGVAPDRSYALVAPVGVSSFTMGGVEAAASAATGCGARGDSMLYMLGGGAQTPFEMSILDNVHGRMRVELSC